MALLEFKSWPGLDEGIFESYVHLNIVVPDLVDHSISIHDESNLKIEYKVLFKKRYDMFY